MQDRWLNGRMCGHLCQESTSQANSRPTKMMEIGDDVMDRMFPLPRGYSQQYCRLSHCDQASFFPFRSLTRPTPRTNANLKINGPAVVPTVTQSPDLHVPGDKNTLAPISAQYEYMCAASLSAMPKSSTFQTYTSCTTLSVTA